MRATQHLALGAAALATIAGAVTLSTPLSGCCEETEFPLAPDVLSTPEESSAIFPTATAVRVNLLPDIAASRPGAKTQFLATVRNTSGDPVDQPVSYRATCGGVSSTGIYTAPTGAIGSCRLIASSGDAADTTEVVILQRTAGRALGVFGLWNTAGVGIPQTGVAEFQASHDWVAPQNIVTQIAAARSKGIRLMLALTGGAHERYKTNGVFDRAKWNAAVSAYNTPAIRQAVAQGVADGTIIGNSVMDEPQQFGTDVKAWGPAGTMTKVRVDSLCTYVKKIFPTLPVGVFHDAQVFQPDRSYRVCEFLMAQYAHRKGSVTAWRDGNLSIVRRDGMEMVFSLNVLDGGVQDKVGVYDCAGTGGIGTHGRNCRMTPQQVYDWGMVLAPPSCALFTWRYDGTFMNKPENVAALSRLAVPLSTMEKISCGRG